MHKIFTYIIILITSILLTSENSIAMHLDLAKIKNLSGYWKFSIGDNPEWSEVSFEDSDWEKIKVPTKWEDQGFFGYDGYAWYRTDLIADDSDLDKSLYLSLGYIDDVDEVFINGKLIGSTGSFPNNYATAYNAKRLYRIPPGTLNPGKNVIAVRVFDMGGEGGIVHGEIALLADRSAIPVEFNLQGEWNFRTGDVEIKENSEMTFYTWDKLIVPGIWEDQGYKNYDGIACYSKEIELNGEFEGERMVLVLGKIDDIDQVFVNGKLVGASGPLNSNTLRYTPEFHMQLRGYYLPMVVLNHNGKNTIVVKVYDAGGAGGMYEGSYGLITQESYTRFWHSNRRR